MYSYIEGKDVNIKLLDGTVFNIDIGELDDTNHSFMKKICDYDENNKLRLHRINLFITKNNDNTHEEYEEKLEYKFENINDGDTICVISDPPPYPKIESSYYLYEIFSIETFYDTIDSLFYKNYEYFRKNGDDLDFIFKIEIDDINLILTLLNYIPYNEKQSIKFWIDKHNCQQAFINAFNIFLEKNDCFSLKSLDISNLRTESLKNSTKLLNLINDKIFLENLHIDFKLLYHDSIYIKTEKLYITFYTYYNYFNKYNYNYGKSLENLINKNHTIFTNLNCIYSTEYFNIEKNDKYYIYRHISNI